LKKIWLVAAFIFLGVILGIGVIFLVTRPPRGEPVLLLPAPSQAPLTIYISGSVHQAGVYTLPYGSRVNDAIIAAGGFTEQANTAGINLAKILVDGEQVNVPQLSPTSSVGGEATSTGLTSGLIDINTATLEELDTLPDIGPKTAQSIIDYRNANGAFKDIEGLLDVDGIGQVTFDKVKPLITVGTSP
jgi:competence protein ComEA